jgi:hypothetical protein
MMLGMFKRVAGPRRLIRAKVMSRAASGTNSKPRNL